jgi:hypothetical protein
MNIRSSNLSENERSYQKWERSPLSTIYVQNALKDWYSKTIKGKNEERKQNAFYSAGY